MRGTKQRSDARERVIGPRQMTFAFAGGTVAWMIHLVFAWGLLELACLRGDVGVWVQTTAGLLTAGPLVLAVLSLVSAVRLRARRGRVQVDVLAQERVELLTSVAVFLNALMVAAIAGGGVALLVLEPCG